MLVRFKILNGPTKNELKEAVLLRKEVIFRLEDGYIEERDFPGIIVDCFHKKGDKHTNMMGFNSEWGRFTVAYCFKRKTGNLIHIVPM